LFGRKFVIVTDHKPLKWLMSFKEPTSKIVRWRMQLLQYDYEILYKKGSQNLVADAFSRVEIDMNINDSNSITGTCGDTVHSADEHMDDHIHISEKPLNDFNYQVILKYGAPIESKTEVIFKRKTIQVISELSFTEQRITDILKKTLKPNRTVAIFEPTIFFNKYKRVIKNIFKTITFITF